MIEVDTPEHAWQLHIYTKAYLTYVGSPEIEEFNGYYEAVKKLKQLISSEVQSGE